MDGLEEASKKLSPCDVKALQKCLERNNGDHKKCLEEVTAFQKSCGATKSTNQASDKRQ